MVRVHLSNIMYKRTAYQDIIINIARLKSLVVEDPGEKPKGAATAIVDDSAIFVALEGVIDLSQETKRLEKEIGKLAKELTGISRKLNNEDFLSKAPAQVVAKVKEKHTAIIEKQQKLKINLDKIKKI